MVIAVEANMNGGIRIGKIWNIPISLHVSWFIIFGLLTWSLATGYFPTEYTQLSPVVYWILAVFTSVFFFASVLAHELGHSYVALKRQIPVKGITLFIFGGVAQISQEPRSASDEFKVAITGPLVSLFLAGFFALLWVLDKALPALAAPSVYLLRINLMLALFNMIPGFPLDGGRVLRAIVWKITGSFHKATQVASMSGQVVAFGFMGIGVLIMLSGQVFNGLWMVFIGWFMQNAAASAYAQLSVQESLKRIKVAEVMSRDLVKVPSLTPLSRLVDENILSGGQRTFFVADNGSLLGMVTLRDIAEVPKTLWGFTAIGKIMRPFQRLQTVSPQTDLLVAMQQMDSANIAQVPVVESNNLVGMLSREQIVRYLRMRVELGV
jgi:Zn-dependent protease